jgi:hypothetical protein
MAILTPDRLLLPIADWTFVVSACRAASLNEDEPTMELAPPVDAAAEDVAELAAALLAAAVLAGALLAAVDELLLDGEEHAAKASAPAVTARPAAIFLFIRNLLGWLPRAQWLDKGRSPLLRCSR